MKTDSDIFFDFKDGIKIVSNNFNNKIYGLKLQNNGFMGAIFRNEKGKIYLKLKI